jgi:hypothetical protein
MLNKPEISSIRDPHASGSEAAISEVVKHSLSIITRVRTNLEDERLVAMSLD